MSRNFLKYCAQLTTSILILPLYAAYALCTLISSKDSCFASYSQLLSLLPGTTGSFLRCAFYRMSMARCHINTYIGFGTLFAQQQTEIGEGVYIGPQCNIGKSKIEAHCLLGSGVHIMSGRNQHNFDDLDTPIREQGGNFERITIGEDSWIGNGALVMANVGKKCIVAAGSVVIHDIPDCSIVAGNPAKIIKSRLRQ